MTLQQIKKAIGKGNFPKSNTKLTFPDFALSPKNCITGRKLSKLPLSTCSICYGKKGNYTFPNVEKSCQKRKNLIDKELFNLETWLIFLLKTYHVEYFRFFANGDLQSFENLVSFAKVAYSCEKVNFWLSTKEVKFINKYLETFGTFPENLNIRLSNYFINSIKFNNSVFLKDKVTFSSVNLDKEKQGKKGFITCPAYRKSRRTSDFGTCGSCKACFSKKVLNINYIKH